MCVYVRVPERLHCIYFLSSLRMSVFEPGTNCLLNAMTIKRLSPYCERASPVSRRDRILPPNFQCHSWARKSAERRLLDIECMVQGTSRAEESRPSVAVWRGFVSSCHLQGNLSCLADTRGYLAFRVGNTNTPFYQGQYIAAAQDIVFVSVKYAFQLPRRNLVN